MTAGLLGPSASVEDAFTDPAVRDLAWLLFAPGLLAPARAGAPLADPTADAPRATLDYLHALDRDPAALHARVHRPALRRLGFYAEALLEFFLMHGPAARLVAANLPLRRAGVTIGECDFLLETPRGARLHWELAAKFYLHVGEGKTDCSPLAGYVGPNLKDRFDLKHARLIGHQLALSAREEFATLGFEGPWAAQLFIKGRLFYRHGEVPNSPDSPDSPGSPIAADHPRGWWMTASEWRARDAAASGDVLTAILPRLAWLAPRELSAADAAALREHRPELTQLDTPAMVAQYIRREDAVWIEHSRGFVVPDDWPDRAAAYASSVV